MLLVAHRAPSDARAAAALAAAGAQAFEVDVQEAGGRLVVSHFAAFGPVQHDGWRWRRQAPPGGDPGLLELVARLPAGALVLLDLKAPTATARARLVAALVAGLPERARFRVSTSVSPALDALRASGFGTWRTAGDRRTLAELLAAGPLADEAVSVRHTLLSAAVVDELHAVVPTVVAWTVNEVPRARQVRELGVDGVTTDSVHVLRALADRAAG